MQGFPHSLQGNLLSEVSLLTEVFLAAVFSLEDAFLFFLLLAAFYLFWAKLPLPQGFVPLNSVDVDIGTLWVALPYDLPIFQSSNSPSPPPPPPPPTEQEPMISWIMGETCHPEPKTLVWSRNYGATRTTRRQR